MLSRVSETTADGVVFCRPFLSRLIIIMSRVLFFTGERPLCHIIDIRYVYRFYEGVRFASFPSKWRTVVHPSYTSDDTLNASDLMPFVHD